MNSDDLSICYTPIPEEEWVVLWTSFGHKPEWEYCFKVLQSHKKNKFVMFYLIHDHAFDFVKKYGMKKIVANNIKFSFHDDYTIND